jgi:phage anti-repressor protein
MNSSAKAFVKQLSTVPERFIDELFELYNEDNLQTDFVIKLDAIAAWLQTPKKNLVKTLKSSYKVKIDYVVNKRTLEEKKNTQNNNYKVYMLTPDCFKRLAMLSRSKNAEMVRTYFIEVEGLFLKYRTQTTEGMQQEIDRLKKNQKSHHNDHEGYMYIIRAVNGIYNLYKIGRTADLSKRLNTYNTSAADEIEILYKYRTDKLKATEGCVKAWLQEYNYRKYKEVYEVDIDVIKKVISQCGSIGAKLVAKEKGRKEMVGGHYLVFTK